MSRNNVLFYSNHCPFSAEVVGLITKRDLKDQFVFVNIDSHANRSRIPREIDRVPALWIRDLSKVLFEDQITDYIGYPEEDMILPVEQPTSAYSENFSFLEEDSSIETTASKGFALFGQEQHIHTPDDDSGGGKAGKADNGGMLDRYMSQRAKDVTSIFGEK